ncbi:MAG: hypothetical protein KF778_05945 [Rhodocyclaceae bacterium]|nr:hypothetical protein [Rhodocyclaceae bacterium]MBX3667927.1 hypothetical protein [Rhodocyclaceae bacterium]
MRPSRFLAWLIILLLVFMRLAVNAHACGYGDDGTENLNPTLCHLHCVDPQSAAGTDVPALATAVAPHLVAVLPAPLEPAAPRPGINSPLRRTDPPPLLAYCVMLS